MSKHPKIIVSPNRGFAGSCVAFTAMMDDYDFGDPVGVGETEDDARADLMQEIELHEQA